MSTFRRPARVPSPSSITRKSLTFLGNYQHPPSVDAALYCARKVLPRLLDIDPEATLTLIGVNPTEELLELNENPAIEVTGFVEDYRPYLWNAAAFIAPIFTGSGMRVKVLEAMACGTPVIATPLAMRGIGAEDETHFFQAETLDQFLSACVLCLESPETAAKVGTSGRDLIEVSHSSEIRAREREAIWQQIIDRTHAEKSGLVAEGE